MCEGERTTNLETKRASYIICPKCLFYMNFVDTMLSDKVICKNEDCILHNKIYLIQEQKIKLLAIGDKTK